MKIFLKCFKTFYKMHVLLKNFKMLLVEDIKFRVKLKKTTQYSIPPVFYEILLPVLDNFSSFNTVLILPVKVNATLR